MSDLISRQALCEYALNQKDKTITPNDIMRFPSAQPKKRTEERTETHGVCLDAIDRQAVIDTVRKIILGFFSDEDGVMNDTEKTLLSVSKAVCNGVRELPSAPSRPQEPQISFGTLQLVCRNQRFSPTGYGDYQKVCFLTYENVCNETTCPLLKQEGGAV